MSLGWATTTITVSAGHEGAIADVDCAVGAAPCLTAPHHNGFRLDETEVIYWGLCTDCFTPVAVRSRS